MRWNSNSRLTLVACAAILLAGCVDSAKRYQDYATYVVATGGLRTETAPADAPYGNQDLVRNFERIAFFTEYSRKDGELVQEETASKLSRWDETLVLTLQGDGVRAEDETSYRTLARRLSKLTGVDVSVSPQEADVSIYILSPEARRAFAQDLTDEDRKGRLQIISDWSEDFRYPCVALVGYDDQQKGVISKGVIVIKAELEGVMRESCIHEELTQVMGLMNDHSEVRPSIFNDDEEFALLTEHDEYLLRILYDDRLRPAMTLIDARPLIPEIVEDIRAGD